MSPTGQDRLTAAFERRRSYTALLKERGTDCFRLVNGSADGFLGLAIDCYGDWAVFQVFEGAARWQREELLALAAKGGEAGYWKGVYLKNFTADRSAATAPVESYEATPFWGEAAPESVELRESGLRFHARLHAGFSTGVFMDQRENRQRLAELPSVGSALNLFCYTSIFSLGFAARGAETTNVDLSQKYLQWGRENFQLNGFDPKGHYWWASDAREYLRRAIRKGRKWQAIVLDPPTFSRGKSGEVFRVEKDLAGLLAECGAVLEPGGVFLLSVNTVTLSAQDLVQALIREPRFKSGSLERRDLPMDFSGGDYPMKAVIYRDR